MRRFGIITLVLSIIGLGYGGYLLGDGYLTTERKPDPDEDRKQMQIRDRAFGNASKIAASSVAVAAVAIGALVADVMNRLVRIEARVG